MRINWAVVGIVIIIAMAVIGEMYAYLPDDRGYSTDADYDGNSASYSVDSDGAYTCNAVLLDNGTRAPVSQLYIYYDRDYAKVEDGSVHAIGSQPLTAEYYKDQLERQLKIRGVENIKVLDSEELRETLLADGPSVEGKGLMFFSGAIPDTVIKDTNILETWVSNGGSMYWVGAPLGKYMATADELVDMKDLGIDAAKTFLGTDSYIEGVKAVHDAPMRKMFCFEMQNLNYAPDLNAIPDDRKVLGTGYTDNEGHYTLSYISMGSGQVCVISGDFRAIQTRDVSLSVSSGLTCDTKILDHERIEFSKHMSSDMQGQSTGRVSLYIALGEYYCSYAQRYDF